MIWIDKINNNNSTKASYQSNNQRRSIVMQENLQMTFLAVQFSSFQKSRRMEKHLIEIDSAWLH